MAKDVLGNQDIWESDGILSELLEDNFIRCEHIETNLMVADVLTKPMGGAKFREFRRLMMNYDLEDMEGENTEEDENN